ncbi:MAG: GNAT family N-acetyltransferase, partial [Mycobacterium sp.]
MAYDVLLRSCAGPAEWPALAQIWRSAVTATHDFLTSADIDFFESRLLAEYLGAVRLTVATVGGVAVAFSGLAEGKLEMLFVDQQYRGSGVGSVLLRDAIVTHPGLLVDVNEQNTQAVGFYRRHGFVTVGRQETDPEGRLFPILNLALRPDQAG